MITWLTPGKPGEMGDQWKQFMLQTRTHYGFKMPAAEDADLWLKSAD